MAIKEREVSGAISGTAKNDRGCTAAKIVLNYYSRDDGRVAQLGERVLCKHEVAGSIPVTSTNLFLNIPSPSHVASARDHRTRATRSGHVHPFAAGACVRMTS